MEITLTIGGIDTKFSQDFVSIATMKEAAKWMNDFDRTANLIDKLSKTKIDDLDEEDQEEARELFDAETAIDKSMKLILVFFNDQFTYDELERGSKFKNVAELHQLAHDIYLFAFQSKNEVEKKPQKKSRKKSV